MNGWMDVDEQTGEIGGVGWMELKSLVLVLPPVTYILMS